MHANLPGMISLYKYRWAPAYIHTYTRGHVFLRRALYRLTSSSVPTLIRVNAEAKFRMMTEVRTVGEGRNRPTVAGPCVRIVSMLCVHVCVHGCMHVGVWVWVCTHVGMYRYALGACVCTYACRSTCKVNPRIRMRYVSASCMGLRNTRPGLVLQPEMPCMALTPFPEVQFRPHNQELRFDRTYRCSPHCFGHRRQYIIGRGAIHCAAAT